MVNRTNRQDVADRLQEYGLTKNILGQLSVRELEGLLRTVESITQDVGQKEISRERKKPEFSTTDRKILKALISSSGAISSLMLSKKLDIPLSTVQRRRKKLESEFLEFYYLPKVDELGWHTAFVFISMDGGSANVVGNELLSWEDSVVKVARTMGDERIDLVVEVAYRDSKNLLDICDSIKAVKGVRSLSWIELVSPIGKNTACYESIIDNV